MSMTYIHTQDKKNTQTKITRTIQLSGYILDSRAMTRLFLETMFRMQSTAICEFHKYKRKNIKTYRFGVYE